MNTSPPTATPTVPPPIQLHYLPAQPHASHLPAHTAPAQQHRFYAALPFHSPQHHHLPASSFHAPPYTARRYAASSPYLPYGPGIDPTVDLAHLYPYVPNEVKHRRRTSPQQLKRLEDTFKTDPKPNPALRKSLSLELGMTTRNVQVWFQNRRAKAKNLAKRRAKKDAESGSPADPSAARSASSPKDEFSSSTNGSTTTPSPAAESSPATPDEDGNAEEAESIDTQEEDMAPPAAFTRHGSMPSLAVSSGLSPVAQSPGPASAHPFANYLTDQNGAPRMLHPHHHHSYSAHALPNVADVGMQPPHTARAASFHALPFQEGSPYAFPPRARQTFPGPGPLPEPDYSFGSAAAPPETTPLDELPDFDVRPYDGGAGYDPRKVAAHVANSTYGGFPTQYTHHRGFSTGGYTDDGLPSRIGSVVSNSGSDASGLSLSSANSAWDTNTSASEQWDKDVRRGSSASLVVDMFSGLDVSRSSISGPSSASSSSLPSSTDFPYESMWDDSPASEEEKTPPAGTKEHPTPHGHGHGLHLQHPPPISAPVPISRTSELAHALFVESADAMGMENAGGDMLELHHALVAGYSDPTGIGGLRYPPGI